MEEREIKKNQCPWNSRKTKTQKRNQFYYFIFLPHEKGKNVSFTPYKRTETFT